MDILRPWGNMDGLRGAPSWSRDTLYYVIIACLVACSTSAHVPSRTGRDDADAPSSGQCAGSGTYYIHEYHVHGGDDISEKQHTVIKPVFPRAQDENISRDHFNQTKYIEEKEIWLQRFKELNKELVGERSRRLDIMTHLVAWIGHMDSVGTSKPTQIQMGALRSMLTTWSEVDGWNYTDIVPEDTTESTTVGDNLIDTTASDGFDVDTTPTPVTYNACNSSELDSLKDTVMEHESDIRDAKKDIRRLQRRYVSTFNGYRQMVVNVRTLKRELRGWENRAGRLLRLYESQFVAAPITAPPTAPITAPPTAPPTLPITQPPTETTAPSTTNPSIATTTPTATTPITTTTPIATTTITDTTASTTTTTTVPNVTTTSPTSQHDDDIISLLGDVRALRRRVWCLEQGKQDPILCPNIQHPVTSPPINSQTDNVTKSDDATFKDGVSPPGGQAMMSQTGITQLLGNVTSDFSLLRDSIVDAGKEITSWTDDRARARRPRDCSEIDYWIQRREPEQIIYMEDRKRPVKTLCDEGWNVIMRNSPYGENPVDWEEGVDRTWQHYKYGFGMFDTDLFWFGNAYTSLLTNQADYQLRVDMVRADDNVKIFSEYAFFRVTSEKDGFRLQVGDNMGSAGDILGVHSPVPVDRHRFSTLDHHPGDLTELLERYREGWWYPQEGDISLTEQGIPEPCFTHLTHQFPWICSDSQGYQPLGQITMKIRPLEDNP